MRRRFHGAALFQAMLISSERPGYINRLIECILLRCSFEVRCRMAAACARVAPPIGSRAAGYPGSPFRHAQRTPASASPRGRPYTRRDRKTAHVFTLKAAKRQRSTAIFSRVGCFRQNFPSQPVTMPFPKPGTADAYHATSVTSEMDMALCGSSFSTARER